MTASVKLGRPYLGERHVVTSRMPIPVRDALDEIAALCNTDRSTVLADLACCAVGKPDLARMVRFDPQVFRPISDDVAAQEVLPLAM
ncbi:hypothetical protein [Mycolicibacterium sp. 120270]|uniref:hypothetical protein n=1 Tax=Mycolicibacterium sp. 120270 TaxID=3090600 RepID=UPI00299E9CD4|nr:hypothetical protein [Mycolicibacterium sp. 120270]MDX1887906.1 hypothetical protein [Mycolicibacterium sp. 120270]